MIYIYIYINVCIHIYIYIYIYIYAPRPLLEPSLPPRIIRRRENMVGVNMVLAEYHQNTRK